MKAKARPGERPTTTHQRLGGLLSLSLALHSVGPALCGHAFCGPAGVDAGEAPSIGHTRAGEDGWGRKVKVLPLTQHRARYQGTGCEEVQSV